MNAPKQIEVPAPTAWPVVLAFGLSLMAAGLVTAIPVSMLGAVLALAGMVGWFRNVLPVEAHEWIPASPEENAIQTERQTVERIEGVGAVARAWLPLEIYPISAGIKGGLAGGAVMAGLAAVYGLLSGNGLWYPVNLLVAGLFPAMANETTRQIATFSRDRLMVAVGLHLLISVTVGLLYGAMLPMLPRRPVLLGGVATPLLWSGLIYGMLAIVDPVMNRHIDWAWFAASRLGFGVVAGLVVARQELTPTRQIAPLIIRMGFEAAGLEKEPRVPEQLEDLRP